MKSIILIVICVFKISYSQESDHNLNYLFKFPHKQHTLILSGYKESENAGFISAAEFFVINNKTSDTLVFFHALQNCLIDKNNLDTLVIIETKKLPVSYLGKLKDFKYLKYTFILDTSGRIIMDTVLAFDFPKLTKADKVKIVEEYKKAEKKEGVNNVVDDFTYYILYLALNNDSWAKEKLFKMQKELKLDGYIWELNDDAINIYKTYNNLKQKSLGIKK